MVSPAPDPDACWFVGHTRPRCEKKFAALAAHDDKAQLRERQLAWRDARSAVTDPARLTILYDERIRKLNAAAAEAHGLKSTEP